MGSDMALKSPASSVVTARVAPVSRLLTVTATPRMPTPDASSTLPGNSSRHLRGSGLRNRQQGAKTTNRQSHREIDQREILQNNTNGPQSSCGAGNFARSRLLGDSSIHALILEPHRCNGS